LSSLPILHKIFHKICINRPEVGAGFRVCHPATTKRVLKNIR
jgi:hypothetical protein